MMRVLVVEDSPTQAQELAFLLESEGFQVDLASDGFLGLERVRGATYDVVLSDVVMPGLDGYEMCRRIKVDPRTSGVPVILLTSLAEPMDIIRGLECGADNFITKPYDVAYLVGRVRHLLENRGLRAERKITVGVDLLLMGRRFTINSEKEQMLDLLISTFEEVVRSRQREYEAKLGEEAHRESHRFLQSALDALSAQIAIIDESGRIQAVNASWRKFAEKNRWPFPDAGVRARYLDVWVSAFGNDPEQQRVVSEGLSDVSFGRREVFQCELRARVSDRERWFSLSATRFEGHGPVLVAIEHQDITERRLAQDSFARHAEELARSERALRDQTRILRSVLDSLGDGVVVADQEGKILLANPAAARICNIGTEFPVERWATAYRARFPESKTAASTSELPLWRAIRGESTDDVAMVVDVASGTEVAISITGRPLIDETGASRGGVVVVHDESERNRAAEALRRTEDQLRQSQKMEAIGQLAGGVAHDFNNLLVVITSYSELLLRDFSSEDPRREDVEEIQRAAQRAAGLTRQLLAFSRRQVFQPVVLDLNHILRDVEKMLRRVIGEDIGLVVQLDPGLRRLKADAGQIEQIVVNLAVNARDAMPNGGTLTIETRNLEVDGPPRRPGPLGPREPAILLSVRDTGTGMSTATQARIFEPFFTTKELGKGTGLGLSTVFGIVQQSGGHIGVASTLGQGTTFEIRLPAVNEPLTAAEPSAPRRPFQARSATILLVEDEEAVRQVICRVLRNEGFTVLEAPRAEDARLLCAQHPQPIHLLLTDIVMPTINGSDLALELVRSRPEMKVLHMSGYAGAGDAHPLSPPRVRFFLEKPFTPESLVRKVREVLDMQLPRTIG